MNRRKFAITLGTVAGGSAAAFSTGAFSAVTANRNFDVEVSGDESAYLGLEPHPGPNGNYAEITTGGQLAIDFTSSNSNIGSGIEDGEGVNDNAVSTFLDVFRATNQGTQEIELDIEPLLFINVGSGALLGVLLPQALNPVSLTPGQSRDFDVIVFSFSNNGQSNLSISDQLEIVAEA